MEASILCDGFGKSIGLALVGPELESAPFQFQGSMVRGRKLAFVDHILAVWDWLLQIVGQSSVSMYGLAMIPLSLPLIPFCFL